MHSDGAETPTLTFTICHRRLARAAHELLRFHVKWHRDALLDPYTSVPVAERVGYNRAASDAA